MAIEASAIREQLRTELTPFLFEINDRETRTKITNKLTVFLKGLSIFDYRVVCDRTNNTKDRIVENELKVDVMIQETEEEEFTYIPITIGKNGWH